MKYKKDLTKRLLSGALAATVAFAPGVSRVTYAAAFKVPNGISTDATTPKVTVYNYDGNADDYFKFASVTKNDVISVYKDEVSDANLLASKVITTDGTNVSLFKGMDIPEPDTDVSSATDADKFIIVKESAAGTTEQLTVNIPRTKQTDAEELAITIVNNSDAKDTIKIAKVGADLAKAVVNVYADDELSDKIATGTASTTADVTLSVNQLSATSGKVYITAQAPKELISDAIDESYGAESFSANTPTYAAVLDSKGNVKITTTGAADTNSYNVYADADCTMLIGTVKKATGALSFSAKKVLAGSDTVYATYKEPKKAESDAKAVKIDSKGITKIALTANGTAIGTTAAVITSSGEAVTATMTNFTDSSTQSDTISLVGVPAKTVVEAYRIADSAAIAPQKGITASWKNSFQINFARQSGSGLATGGKFYYSQDPITITSKGIVDVSHLTQWTSGAPVSLSKKTTSINVVYVDSNNRVLKTNNGSGDQASATFSFTLPSKRLVKTVTQGSAASTAEKPLALTQKGLFLDNGTGKLVLVFQQPLTFKSNEMLVEFLPVPQTKWTTATGTTEDFKAVKFEIEDNFSSAKITTTGIVAADKAVVNLYRDRNATVPFYTFTPGAKPASYSATLGGLRAGTGASGSREAVAPEKNAYFYVTVTKPGFAESDKAKYEFSLKDQYTAAPLKQFNGGDANIPGDFDNSTEQRTANVIVTNNDKGNIVVTFALGETAKDHVMTVYYNKTSAVADVTAATVKLNAAGVGTIKFKGYADFYQYQDQFSVTERTADKNESNPMKLVVPKTATIKPSTKNITIVNNGDDQKDFILTTGYAAGAVVEVTPLDYSTTTKLYTPNTGKKSTVNASDESIPDGVLGAVDGKLRVTVTEPGKGQSEAVDLSYKAEPQTAKPLAANIDVVYGAGGTTKTVEKISVLGNVGDRIGIYWKDSTATPAAFKQFGTTKTVTDALIPVTFTTEGDKNGDVTFNTRLADTNNKVYVRTQAINFNPSPELEVALTVKDSTALVASKVVVTNSATTNKDSIKFAAKAVPIGASIRVVGKSGGADKTYATVAAVTSAQNGNGFTLSGLELSEATGENKFNIYVKELGKAEVSTEITYNANGQTVAIPTANITSKSTTTGVQIAIAATTAYKLTAGDTIKVYRTVGGVDTLWRTIKAAGTSLTFTVPYSIKVGSDTVSLATGDVLNITRQTTNNSESAKTALTAITAIPTAAKPSDVVVTNVATSAADSVEVKFAVKTDANTIIKLYVTDDETGATGTYVKSLAANAVSSVKFTGLTLTKNYVYVTVEAPNKAVVKSDVKTVVADVTTSIANTATVTYATEPADTTKGTIAIAGTFAAKTKVELFTNKAATTALGTAVTTTAAATSIAFGTTTATLDIPQNIPGFYVKVTDDAKASVVYGPLKFTLKAGGDTAKQTTAPAAVSTDENATRKNVIAVEQGNGTIDITVGKIVKRNPAVDSAPETTKFTIDVFYQSAQGAFVQVPDASVVFKGATDADKANDTEKTWTVTSTAALASGKIYVKVFDDINLPWVSGTASADLIKVVKVTPEVADIVGVTPAAKVRALKQSDGSVKIYLGATKGTVKVFKKSAGDNTPDGNALKTESNVNGAIAISLTATNVTDDLAKNAVVQVQSELNSLPKQYVLTALDEALDDVFPAPTNIPNTSSPVAAIYTEAEDTTNGTDFKVTVGKVSKAATIEIVDAGPDGDITTTSGNVLLGSADASTSSTVDISISNKKISAGGKVYVGITPKTPETQKTWVSSALTIAAFTPTTTNTLAAPASLGYAGLSTANVFAEFNEYEDTTLNGGFVLHIGALNNSLTGKKVEIFKADGTTEIAGTATFATNADASKVSKIVVTKANLGDVSVNDLKAGIKVKITNETPDPDTTWTSDLITIAAPVTLNITDIAGTTDKITAVELEDGDFMITVGKQGTSLSGAGLIVYESDDANATTLTEIATSKYAVSSNGVSTIIIMDKDVNPSFLALKYFTPSMTADQKTYRTPWQSKVVAVTDYTAVTFPTMTSAQTNGYEVAFTVSAQADDEIWIFNNVNAKTDVKDLSVDNPYYVTNDTASSTGDKIITLAEKTDGGDNSKLYNTAGNKPNELISKYIAVIKRGSNTIVSASKDLSYRADTVAPANVAGASGAKVTATLVAADKSTVKVGMLPKGAKVRVYQWIDANTKREITEAYASGKSYVEVQSASEETEMSIPYKFINDTISKIVVSAQYGTRTAWVSNTSNGIAVTKASQSVMGTVTSNTTAVEGIDVSLLDSGGNVVATQKTGSNGKYNFAYVSLGNGYTVTTAETTASPSVIGYLSFTSPSFDFPYSAADAVKTQDIALTIAPYEITGTVTGPTDVAIGTAVITVSHEVDGTFVQLSPMVTTNGLGKYVTPFKLISGDRYKIEVDKTGFLPMTKTITATNTTDAANAVLDFKMTAVSRSAARREMSAPVVEPTVDKEETKKPVKETVDKEETPTKEEVAPTKEEVTPVEEVTPTKEEVTPVKEEVAPAKEEVTPVKEEVAPVKEETPVQTEETPVV